MVRRLCTILLAALSLCVPAIAALSLSVPAARAAAAPAALGLSEGAILTTPRGPVAFACTLARLPDCRGASAAAAFARFQATAGRGFRYVRAGIPWDAVADAGCRRASTPPGRWGMTYIDAIERFVLAARRSGLDPLITITDNDTSGGANTGATGDPRNPSLRQYECGFLAITSTLDAYAAEHAVAPPSEYETYNEPEGARIGTSCASGLPSGYLPPLGTEQCAAWYFYGAQEVNRVHFAGAETLVALGADGDSVNAPSLAAIADYAHYLTGTLGVWPAVWSVHPYEDVSASAYYGTPMASGTAAVDGLLASLYMGRPKPQLWLTEAAVLLTDRVGSYRGQPPVTCANGEPDDAHTFGACIDGNTAAQAAGAEGFLRLPAQAGAAGVPVTRAYWHQFDVIPNHPSSWDSGLLAAGGQARTSLCVLAGASPAAAVADPGCDTPAAALDSEDSMGS